MGAEIPYRSTKSDTVLDAEILRLSTSISHARYMYPPVPCCLAQCAIRRGVRPSALAHGRVVALRRARAPPHSSAQRLAPLAQTREGGAGRCSNHAVSCALVLVDDNAPPHVYLVIMPGPAASRSAPPSACAHCVLDRRGFASCTAGRNFGPNACGAGACVRVFVVTIGRLFLCS